MFAEPFNEGCRDQDLAAGQAEEIADQAKGDDTAATDGAPKHPAQQLRRGGLAYHSASRSYRFL